MKRKLFMVVMLSIISAFFTNGFSQYVANGNASLQNALLKEYQLTPDNFNQNGSVWYQTRVDLQFNFSIEAEVFLGYNDGGADGIAFVLQSLSVNAGSAGGGIGYNGINPSFAIEFDTWQNCDPAEDHIAMVLNGVACHNPATTIQGPSIIANVEDGQWHPVKFTWNAATKNFKFYWNGSSTAFYDVVYDIQANIFGGSPFTYFGFTAATGSARNDHRIRFGNAVFVSQGVSGVVTDPTCSSATNGAVNITVTGGTPPYTFLWSNGFTGEDLTGVGNGTYTVTVTDAAMPPQSVMSSFDLFATNPCVQLNVLGVVSDPSCLTATNGGVNITVTGGTPPYTYAWSNGFMGEDLTGVGNGTYTVTVTDASNPSISGSASFDLFATNPCEIIGKITAAKFYDANANGFKDAGENFIEGWEMTLTPGNIVAFTNAMGVVTFDNLALGVYQVTEGTSFGWINTTPLTADVILNALNPVENILFGNVCVAGGGGHTPGFWSNKNGQGLITGNYLCALNMLCLRNENGSHFDPVVNCPIPNSTQIAAGKSLFKTWLLDATATNMAYKLSSHLAAMKLNVMHGFVNGAALIYAPGTNSANAMGIATVNAVMNEANTILCSNGSILSGDPLRMRAEAVKDALDNANNNLNFISTGNCTFSFQERNASIPSVKNTAEAVNNNWEEKMQIKVWPNPSEGLFNLTISSLSNEPVFFKVMDVSGKQVLQLQGNSKQLFKFGNSLVKGMYFVELVQGDKKATIKIIKN
jgi:hypothetical protein